MKKQTRDRLRGAGWTLVAAGTFGLCTTATAQTSTYPTPSAWTQGRSQEDQVVVADAQTRAAQSKVELAWLADPATFPYHLETRQIGTALEVRGYVPHLSIRDQALRIAREQSGMRVVDGLKLLPEGAVPLVSKPPEALHRDVTNALERALPHQTRGISVNIWTNGQVLLKGRVPSEQAKLAASRCLTRVGGCSCVVNQLVVAPEARPQDRSLFTKLYQMSTGKDQAPAGRPGTATVLSSEPIATSRNEGLVQAAHSEPVADGTKPTAAAGNNSLPTAAAEPRLFPVSTPASGGVAASESKPTKSPLGYFPTRWRRLGADTPPAAENAAVATVAAPRPANDPAPAVVPPAAVPPARPAVADTVKTCPALAPAASWKPTPANAVQPIPGKPESQRVVLEKPAPVSPVTPVREEPAALRPVVYTSQPQLAAPEPSSGFSSIARKDNSSRASPPAEWMANPAYENRLVQPTPATTTVKTPPLVVSKPEPARPSTGAYVSSGVIFLESPEAEVRPRPSLEQEFRQTRLRESIARACGKAPKDVEVTITSDSGLLVNVKAHSREEGDRLSTVIFQLPELNPYRVSLEIPLVP
jgi:osmotically-inducible protein OsmY